MGWKASYGQPDGTVIGRIGDTQALINLQALFVPAWLDQPVRLTAPGEFHVTLLHSPLVDDTDFEMTYQVLRDTFKPIPITASKLGLFEQDGYKAFVLFIDPSPALVDYQQLVYGAFRNTRSVISRYSLPENFKPHITLAYLPEGEFEENFGEWPVRPVVARIDGIAFSRGSHDTLHNVWDYENMVRSD